MKTVALIPIKLNSQRLPHKNLLPLADHPLCWHICNTLNRIKFIDAVYVYCSDPAVKNYIPEETTFLQRPAWLDRDEIKGADIYKEFIKQIDSDLYILAHTTSPLLKSDSIQNALEHVLSGEYDSAFSAQRVQTFSWYKDKPLNYSLGDVPRTQDLKPIWVETSGFYIFPKKLFTEQGRRIGYHPFIQEVSGAEAIDIDEQKDYDLACAMVSATQLKSHIDTLKTATSSEKDVSSSIVTEGRRVFDAEIRAMQAMCNVLDATFEKIVFFITECKGKVVITGMGKPGHIGTKIAATLASLGTPAFFLHPAEAMHGDLGMISKEDLVIAISYSGESDEIINILPNIKMIGSKLIAITGNSKSTLSLAADLTQVLPPFEEACHLGLAPTSSTTVELAYGDALAVAASSIYGFKDSDFGKIHPAGSLGKKLTLRVKDIMVTGLDNPKIRNNSSMKDAIIQISKRQMGFVSIVDGDENLVGIITDGDLRRILEKGLDVYNLSVDDVMSKAPITIFNNELAITALRKMNAHNINCMPVLSDHKLIGGIKVQMILNAGIVDTVKITPPPPTA